MLIDEPDVHLHPDLQHRLANFILGEISGERVSIILATHSTALLSSLATGIDTKVAFMRVGDQELSFKEISGVISQVLPMFGAHPLSNIFNHSPILLVEGEDDERIWQQAVRSSEGRIKLYPCVTDSVDRQNLFETQANDIIQAVYDEACGYSLRDRDNSTDQITDVGAIVRMKLNCRAAENLLLSDDVLALAGIDWQEMVQRIQSFSDQNPQHIYSTQVTQFCENGFDRKNADLKKIRNVLVNLLSNKPWEVLVGQAIAKLAVGQGKNGDHSLPEYLGHKPCRYLLKLEDKVRDASVPRAA